MRGMNYNGVAIDMTQPVYPRQSRYVIVLMHSGLLARGGYAIRDGALVSN